MNIPKEMKSARRWLVWKMEDGKKIPYYTTGKKRGYRTGLDTSEDMARLASYGEAVSALNGKYSGIGFALGKDEMGGYWQGIDLDDVEANGLQELAGKLPGYREVSPSGKGFHAIGYGRHIDTKGSNGSGVEVYSERRYFTVTGQSGSGDICDIADFVFDELAAIHSQHTQVYVEGTEHIEHTEDIGSLRKSQEVSGSHRQGGGGQTTTTGALPENCKPSATGTRNRVLFNLARHLKSENREASPESMRPIVKAWHATYVHVIATKDFVTTWLDFCNAWEKVRTFEGEGTLDECMKKVDIDTTPPDDLVKLGYEGSMWGCVQLCYLLSQSADDGLFFLGCRDVARLFGVSQRTSGLLLNAMVRHGILEIVHLGTRTKATTYRYIWPHPLEDKHD